LDKGLIKVDMDAEEIKKVFEDNVRYFLPYIKGVNNHMGSLFTANEEKMRILLESIKEKNLYFVDSLTNQKSCGYKIAKELGIKTGKRDIFLDISSEPEQINKKIDQLLKMGKENQGVIAIGHAKSNTIKVLKERISDFEANDIEIVPVSTLLE
ncbi:MAG: divergent polysaccharide deacetylase family protein, partial [Candidatus Omnitrophica bacterium]|nr:divergent polysaccharide deacetylase family protein [Candidatus Omnitrophota bacterium]